ncbi:hypothetical protein [Azospirillum himalayense]|uniref:Uncharacterized protein n=1 Tax=Azospirillum himalayense TaxID=654847 RepID=A0ABW0G636_9PROT
MFNHHIPANERDYAHFTRCVERWRAVMASSDPILFVLVTQSPDGFPTFSSLAAALETITARPALLFLTMDPTCPELPIAEVRLEAEVGSHVAWRMRPLSPLGPTQFGILWTNSSSAGSFISMRSIFDALNWRSPRTKIGRMREEPRAQSLRHPRNGGSVAPIRGHGATSSGSHIAPPPRHTAGTYSWLINAFSARRPPETGGSAGRH